MINIHWSHQETKPSHAVLNEAFVVSSNSCRTKRCTWSSHSQRRLFDSKTINEWIKRYQRRHDNKETCYHISFNSLRLYVLTEENARTFPAFKHVSSTVYTVLTVKGCINWDLRNRGYKELSIHMLTLLIFVPVITNVSTTYWYFNRCIIISRLDIVEGVDNGQNEENDKHCGRGVGLNGRGRYRTERGRRQAWWERHEK